MEFPFDSTVAVAHRGAHGEGRPENSLAAVERTAEIGARAVEFDVVALRDGRLVVSHDEPTGERAESLPDMEQFLRVVAGSDMILNLDWKRRGGEERACGMLRRYGLLERTLVSSTDRRVIARFKQEAPGVATGISLAQRRTSAAEAAREVSRVVRESRADAAMLEYRGASEEMVRVLRGAGVGVFLWTAPDQETYSELASLKPDGIATDAIEQQLDPQHRL
ncbi:glycerophosphodiester phosphodiesterase [Rubrobacter naiadicus]|uniref:glycerophosphodiester phosphodiesterase n=1 Tax=Rubrobacter naiadicus TaxID=1392641 RepID=UPI0023604CBE|nr:glycerophosphodiester phosphodiesterase [Rubrobacter naiadicus]